MKVTDQWHIDSHGVEVLPDLRHRCRGFRRIHGDTHQFGPGSCEFSALDGRPHDINRVGIGHRLDDDRRLATDGHMADADGSRLATHCATLAHRVLAVY